MNTKTKILGAEIRSLVVVLCTLVLVPGDTLAYIQSSQPAQSATPSSGEEKAAPIPPDQLETKLAVRGANMDEVKRTLAPVEAAVRFTTAVYGVHEPGTAYRMDEVPIPLRTFLPAEYPTDDLVLRRIEERLVL